MSSEGIWHVPVCASVARREKHPRLPHKALEEPRVDVAASVVAHIDDEPFTGMHLQQREDRRRSSNAWYGMWYGMVWYGMV